MPKRKTQQRGRGGGKKTQKRSPQGPTRTPEIWRERDTVDDESDNERDLDGEQLEGLEVSDMEVISRMGL